MAFYLFFQIVKLPQQGQILLSAPLTGVLAQSVLIRLPCFEFHPLYNFPNIFQVNEVAIHYPRFCFTAAPHWRMTGTSARSSVQEWRCLGTILAHSFGEHLKRFAGCVFLGSCSLASRPRKQDAKLFLYIFWRIR